jgi:glutamyl-tRNA synthetase
VRKLQHFNAEYIRALDVGAFVERARPFFVHGDATEEVLRPIAPLVQERVRLLTEVEPMVDFLRLDSIEAHVDAASWEKGVVKVGERAPAMLESAAAELASCDWDAAAIEAALEAAARSAGFVKADGAIDMRRAQAPVRVAVTGRSVGPPLYESLAVLGRERTLDRLRAARGKL